MVHRRLRGVCVTVFAVCVSYPVYAEPKGPVNDFKLIQGLWSGAWGGGGGDGVVFQPVIAELVVTGDKVEIAGFPTVGRLAGTVCLDMRARKMQVTPAPGTDDEAAPKQIDFQYEINADQLTLTGSDEIEILLKRHAVVEEPLANVQVEFVTADEINEEGDLLVTEFSTLEVGENSVIYFEPEKRKLAARQAAIFEALESGLHAVSLDDARGLIRKSTPVVVAFGRDDRPQRAQFYELWKDTGPSAPESTAVQRIIARLVRPGTLIFVFSSERENAPP